MYKMKKFSIKPVETVIAEIEAIPARYRNQVDRVFLADGDALIYPFAGLLRILDQLATSFPALTRVAAYASPNSLASKSSEELTKLRQSKLRILYFGLESGDNETLANVNKGFTAEQMASLALKAREAGIKLSVTAILGLAGQERSLEHARATAAWVNQVNPEYFSLLTLFSRHNEPFIRTLRQCSRGELLQEAREIVATLAPAKTILRSNHVSNFLNLAGSYPKDRQRLINDVDAAIAHAARLPGYLAEVPAYAEEYY
jgi:radical SAM superfamily enzyme